MVLEIKEQSKLNISETLVATTYVQGQIRALNVCVCGTYISHRASFKIKILIEVIIVDNPQ